MTDDAREQFECWIIIGLRGGDGFIAGVSSATGAFNTLKFASYAAAVAHCRRQDYHPADYVISRARFTQPEILETRDIDYGRWSLAVASPPEEERT